MFQKSLKLVLAVVLIVSHVFVVCGQGYAEGPTVTLIVNPNKTDVYAGADKIALTAKASGSGLQFAWDLQGPGKLEGSGAAVFYQIPESIGEKSEQAVVTVTVTDSAGQEATETFTFNILPSEKEAEDLAGTAGATAGESAAPEAQKMSMGTKVAIGAAAAAAVGAGVALAVGGGGGEDDDPFDGRFTLVYVDYLDDGSPIDCVTTLNLEQTDNTLTGTREMTRTLRNCCTLELTVSASGVVNGNEATITYGSGEARCDGPGGCWLSYQFYGATYVYTLSADGKVLSSGGSNFIKQYLVGRSPNGAESQTESSEGEQFIRQ